MSNLLIVTVAMTGVMPMALIYGRLVATTTPVHEILRLKKGLKFNE